MLGTIIIRFWGEKKKITMMMMGLGSDKRMITP